MIFRWSQVVSFFAALAVVGWLVFPSEYFRGQMHRDEGDRSLSIAFYSDYLSRHPYHKGAMHALAQAYENAARPEEAAALLEAFYRHRRGDGEAGREVLDILDRAKMTEIAKAFRWELFADLKALPVVDKNQLEGLLYEAFQQATTQQDAAGVDKALQALSELGGSGRGYREELLRHLLSRRDFSKALAFLKDEAARKPRDPEPRRMLVRVHRFMNDQSGALASAQEGLRAFPNDPELLSERVDIRFKMNRCSEAIPDLKTLMALQPKNSSWSGNLGACLVKTGRLIEGIRVYEESLKGDPSDEQRWRTVIFAYSDHGLHPEAAAWLERYLKKFPDSAFGLDLLVYEYEIMDRRDEAANLLRRHLARHPKDPARLRALASLMFNANRYEQAAAAYEALIALQPQDKQAWNDLIHLHNDHRAFPEMAAVLKRYRKRFPDEPNATDQYVYVLRRLGQRAKAVSVMRDYLSRVGAPALFQAQPSTDSAKHDGAAPPKGGG